MAVVEKKAERELPDDAGIRQIAEQADNMHECWQEAEAELALRIRQFQIDCGKTPEGHDFENIMVRERFDDDLLRNGKEAYAGRKCRKCKLFEPRRRGFEWEICRKCGPDMKLVDRIPGQGCRTFVYECVNCGHTTSHT